jgi:glutamyl endopeptidase
MQFRTMTAILVGAALVVTPAFAQTAGNTGPAEKPALRGAPATLPDAAPMAPLKIDASALSRGPLGLDPAAALESLGTETLNSDGSTESKPASEGVRGAIESAMQGSEQAMTDRVVVGPEDRQQVMEATDYPTYDVGLLFMQAQDDSWSTCSGTVIGRFTVLTAAHCVYVHDKGGWVKNIMFAPGMTDPEQTPYGVYEWNNVNILKGYIDNYDGTNYGSVLQWDLAVITMSEAVGDTVGWMGFRVDDGTDWKANIIGYPGDKPEGTMWKNSCTIKPDQFGDLAFWHECDTFAGSSGSSMYEDNAGDLYIRGINVAEDDKVNYGVRLIEPYYQFILDNRPE